MTSPLQLHEALFTLLDGIANITAYDGKVPDNPPVDDSGAVLPYVVLWGSAGFYPDAEAGNLTGVPTGDLDWPVQVTVAAGMATWCIDAAGTVRAAVLGVRLITGAAPLKEEAGAPPIQFDGVTKPGRFFLPLLFRIRTT